jgi:hypothetical protein
MQADALLLWAQRPLSALIKLRTTPPQPLTIPIHADLSPNLVIGLMQCPNSILGLYLPPRLVLQCQRLRRQNLLAAMLSAALGHAFLALTGGFDERENQRARRVNA